MGNSIVVLGGGESGVWAAILAQRNGANVLLSDYGIIDSAYKSLLEEYAIPYEEGGHHKIREIEVDEVIKSPGIPDKAEIIRYFQDRQIPIISEIEYASRYIQESKVIAITGSNGKTTTTTLIDHLLRSSGRDAVACGNIGKSLAQCLVLEPHEFYVIELSSFQLDHVKQFAADIAILTNITPDHLDRYDYKMENYANAKGKIFDNLTPKSLAIYSLDDPETQVLLRRREEMPCQQWTFSQSDERATAYIKGKELCFRYKGNISSFSYSDLPLKGVHNLYNMMVATLAALEIGLSIEEIKQGLQTFVAVEHRMEPVATIEGITFINDSKATNIDSCQYALSAMPEGRCVLMLGGTDKGNDYTTIQEQVKRVAKAIICLTTDSQKLHATFDTLGIPIIDAHSMSEAFSLLQSFHLESGDIVLLSPACASFDLFKNYEDRGRQFKAEVQKLKK